VTDVRTLIEALILVFLALHAWERWYERWMRRRGLDWSSCGHKWKDGARTLYCSKLKGHHDKNHSTAYF
jgi:hypothetical protein